MSSAQAEMKDAMSDWDFIHWHQPQKKEISKCVHSTTFNHDLGLKKRFKKKDDNLRNNYKFRVQFSYTELNEVMYSTMKILYFFVYNI